METSEHLGHLGGAGLAVILAVLLVLGTRPNAKHRLKSHVALAWGFAAITVWISAGGIWEAPIDFLHQALQSAGVGSGEGPAGDIGMGAVAVLLVGWNYFSTMSPPKSAIMGMAMAVVFAAAGGFWSLGVEFVSQITGGLA